VTGRGFVYASSQLPADGRQLVDGYRTERQQIMEEADRRIAERRDAVVKALQDLQEQYTKAGRLDDAVAIRDFLRAGGPETGAYNFVFKRGK
jgi:hypothetical protein